MKTYKTLYLLLAIIMCSIGQTIKAQVSELEISRLIQNLRLLESYIQTINGKVDNQEIKEYYSSKALDLFINHGNSYTINDRVERGSKIKITSIYPSKRPTQRLVKDYINGLAHGIYKTVSFEECTYIIVRKENLIYDNVSKKYKANAYIKYINLKRGQESVSISDEEISFLIDKHIVEAENDTPSFIFFVDINASEKNMTTADETNYSGDRYKKFVKTRNSCSKCDCSGYWGYEHTNGTYEGNCSNYDGHGHTCGHGPEKHGLRKW